MANSSLNPCSNGIWSLTAKTKVEDTKVEGLNPCSNGIWSLTLLSYHVIENFAAVLILVLMEYGL